MTLAVDAVLLGIFLLLMAPRITGLALHEILGVAMAGLVVIHLLLSWRWIAVTSRQMFRDATARRRINYAINLALFVLVVLVIASGLVISEVVLPWAGVTTIDDRAWRALHNQSLNWLMLCAGLHLAMNWGWVARTVGARRWWAGPPIGTAVSVVGRSVLLVAVGGLLAGGAYLVLGAPTVERRYALSEVARYTGRFDRGVVQLAGETLIFVAVAFVGRKWVRLRV